MQELKLLSAELRAIADKIDRGECVASHEQVMLLADTLNRVASPAVQRLSLYDLSREFCVTQRTIQNWERDGVLPPHHNMQGINGNMWFSYEIDAAEPELKRLGYLRHGRKNSFLERIKRLLTI